MATSGNGLLDWLNNIFNSHANPEPYGPGMGTPVNAGRAGTIRVNAEGGIQNRDPSGAYTYQAPQPQGYNPATDPANYHPFNPHEDWGTRQVYHNGMSSADTPAGSGSTTTAPSDPNASTNAFNMAYLNQMTQYQQAQTQLAQQRLEFDRQNAERNAAEAHAQATGNAFQNYYKTVLGYMADHPVTGQAVGAGYLPYDGSSTAQKAPIDPLVAEYYKAHPELGPAPGTAPVAVGYQGAHSIGSGAGAMGAVPLPNLNGAPNAAGTQGSKAVNLPDFMYGKTTGNGTPVPLGPQDQAALGAANTQNHAAFNDYAGNYAGFDPNTLLDQTQNLGGTGSTASSSTPNNFTPGLGY